MPPLPSDLDSLGEAWVIAWRVHHDIALWTADQPCCGAKAVLAGKPAMEHILAFCWQWKVPLRRCQLAGLLHAGGSIPNVTSAVDAKAVVSTVNARHAPAQGRGICSTPDA